MSHKHNKPNKVDVGRDRTQLARNDVNKAHSWGTSFNMLCKKVGDTVFNATCQGSGLFTMNESATSGDLKNLIESLNSNYVHTVVITLPNVRAIDEVLWSASHGREDDLGDLKQYYKLLARWYDTFPIELSAYKNVAVVIIDYDVATDEMGLDGTCVYSTQRNNISGKMFRVGNNNHPKGIGRYKQKLVPRTQSGKLAHFPSPSVVLRQLRMIRRQINK